jgi:CheY-like chemotaxis protein
LVIDDGDWVRDIIGLFLEHAGFEVCGEAADGVEAIEQAKKLKPDLIVLDLAMPRMNGAEAASILSQTMPEVPIVLLTLYQNLLGSALASAVGIKAVLTKQRALASWSRAFVHCYNPLILKEWGATLKDKPQE